MNKIILVLLITLSLVGCDDKDYQDSRSGEKLTRGGIIPYRTCYNGLIVVSFGSGGFYEIDPETHDFVACSPINQ